MLPFKRLTLALCLASGLLLSCINAAPTATTPSLCQISTADRSDTSKLPQQLQEDPNMQPLDLDQIQVNHFSTQIGKNDFGVTFDSEGKINIKTSFDNSHPRIHHHHLFEVTFLLHFKPFESNGHDTETRYFYLKDDDKCHGQEDGALPANSDRLLSVKMLTLNEY